MILFVLSTSTIQAYAYGPTDEEVVASMYALDLFKTSVRSSEDAAWAHDEMRHLTVQLHAGSTFGTGCIFRIDKEELIIVSNRHVIENWKTMQLPQGTEITQEAIEGEILSRAPAERSYVIFYDGSAALATLAGVSYDADVGFLRVPLSQIPADRLIFLRSLSLEEDGVRIQPDDKIFAYESTDIAATFTSRNISLHSGDTGIAQKIHEGSVIYPDAYIEQFSTTMLFALCKAEAGMSGGGIFDLRGNYYGIVTGGNEKGE
ncbi:MAG: trypsin-like peptidase domain-containing protein, partial [Lachnospiraceae bacterium]|nr:trypsin-like peptidase domain-containing protein [Lachnospiraceae bacterium]